MTQRFGYLPMSMSNLIRRFAWQRSARRRKDARSPQTVEVLPPKTRRRLFIKYVALFVAVVWVALLSNGVFDVLLSGAQDVIDSYPDRNGGRLAFRPSRARARPGELRMRERCRGAGA